MPTFTIDGNKKLMQEHNINKTAKYLMMNGLPISQSRPVNCVAEQSQYRPTALSEQTPRTQGDFAQ